MLQDNSFHFEIRGVWGWIVATISFLAVSVPLGLLVWQKLVKPALDWAASRNGLRARVAFLEFKTHWLGEHIRRPMFILDKDRKCVEVNDALCHLLRADSSEILGRGWHVLVKESVLSQTLQKWREAYENQSPYINVTTMLVDDEERKFIVRAEPFIWRGRVHHYIGTIEELGGARIEDV